MKIRKIEKIIVMKKIKNKKIKNQDMIEWIKNNKIIKK